MATLNRLLGDAYLGLGDLLRSRTSLEHALMLLNHPMPTTGRAYRTSILNDMLRQVRYRLRPPKVVSERDPERKILLEVVHILQRLITINYLAGETEPVIYNCFRAANLAERLGPCGELARTTAGVALIAGLIPLHRVARTYGQRALDMGANYSDTDFAWVLETYSLYNLGVGEWALAENAIRRGMEICERLGNHRLWGEFGTARSISYYFQGRFAEGRQSFADVYDAAVRNNNSLQQAWGLNGQAEGLVRLGQPEQAVPMLKAALDLYEQNGDKVSYVVCYGRLALAYLAQKQYDLMKEAAQQGEGLFSQSPPTSFSAMDGYAGVAEAYLVLAEMDRSDPVLNAAAQRACKAFSRYARVFPVGIPHAHLLRGLYEQVNGRSQQAQQQWQKSLAAAERLKMTYAAGRAHYEIGKHLEKTDPQRTAHLWQAVEIFERLGVTAALENARQALAET
jgi:tetratricopeptide (TPR) repeat protein